MKKINSEVESFISIINTLYPENKLHMGKLQELSVCTEHILKKVIENLNSESLRKEHKKYTDIKGNAEKKVIFLKEFAESLYEQYKLRTELLTEKSITGIVNIFKIYEEMPSIEESVLSNELN